tara:strand:+ start:49 stop:963 length:915 start_codon:yes stop_codon:yes gene_type:complete
MNPALEEYINSLRSDVNPKDERAEYLYNKTKNMTDEEQQRFLAGIQMLDTEFATEVQKYLPEGTEVDPTKARFEFYETDLEYSPMLHGAARKGGLSNIDRPLQDEYGRQVDNLTIKPDSVTAIQYMNANPRVFSHEYLHYMGLDDFVEDGDREFTTRVLDLLAARTDADYKDALFFLSQQFARPHRSQRTSLEKGLYKIYMDQADRVVSDDITPEELDKIAMDLLKTRGVQKILKSVPEDMKPALGRKYKDLRESKSTSINLFGNEFFKMYPKELPDFREEKKEGGKLDYLPDAYRDGGRTKII